MFPEPRLLHEKLNEFNRMARKGMCVIIVAKVVQIGQTIVTHFARLPRVDAHQIEHFVQPIEQSMEQSEVPNGCNHRVAENRVDICSAQAVVGTPVPQ
jgi:hypothetical protein